MGGTIPLYIFSTDMLPYYDVIYYFKRNALWIYEFTTNDHTVYNAYYIIIIMVYYDINTVTAQKYETGFFNVFLYKYFFFPTSIVRRQRDREQ